VRRKRSPVTNAIAVSTQKRRLSPVFKIVPPQSVSTAYLFSCR